VKVEHTDFASFLEDLKRVAGKFDDVFVRTEAVREKVNSGVESVSLIHGFHDEHYLYEITIDCGEELVGGEDHASECVKVHTKNIQGWCKELKISHGGGRWQLPEA